MLIKEAIISPANITRLELSPGIDVVDRMTINLSLHQTELTTAAMNEDGTSDGGGASL